MLHTVCRNSYSSERLSKHVNFLEYENFVDGDWILAELNAHLSKNIRFENFDSFIKSGHFYRVQ